MSADNLPNASAEELLEFFWCEPIQNDDIVVYVVTDAMGIELRFALAVAEHSIQTMLSLGDDLLDVVSHEMLAHFRIYENRLIAICQYANGSVKLELTVRPKISVRWSGLRTC